MGLYDSVIVNCPKCGEGHFFQSKSGECFLENYTLENCPDNVLADVNRHSPYDCDCGTCIKVDIPTRMAVVLNRLQKALSNKIWINHNVGDEYQMDGKKYKWKIAYYPIFEDGKTGDNYDEPRALVESPLYGKFNEKIGTDFREVPLRYLTKIKK